MDTLEQRMASLASSWQRTANRKIEAGDDAVETFETLLTISIANLLSLRGPDALLHSLTLAAGMVIKNSGSPNAQRH